MNASECAYSALKLPCQHHLSLTHKSHTCERTYSAPHLAFVQLQTWLAVIFITKGHVSHTKSMDPCPQYDI